MGLFDVTQTPDGKVMVLTKTRMYCVLKLPHTSVMSPKPSQLVGKGVQLHWTTGDPAQLARLQGLVPASLRELTLGELRSVAEMGRELLAAGLPFVPADAPLPEPLRQLATYVKRVK